MACWNALRLHGTMNSPKQIFDGTFKRRKEFQWLEGNLHIYVTNLRMTAYEKCYTNYKLIRRRIRFSSIHKRATA